MVGYSDASHAAEDLGWKSMSGYVFLVAGGAVSWSAKKQSLIALSTAELEYITMTHATKELLWICHFTSEVLGPLSLPTILYADNQSAITLTRNNLFSPQTKHIALCYHFIHEVVTHFIMSLIWIASNSNLADIFTKSLDVYKVTTLSTGLGLFPGRRQ
jgi:hypothetical protein